MCGELGTCSHVQQSCALILAQHVRELDLALDLIDAGSGFSQRVLYMATVMNGVQKSGLRKLIRMPAYRDMTIRTYSTCQRILALMERG